jgi:uncharacterized lipoprotein YajG
MDAATMFWQRVEQLCLALYKSINAGRYRNRFDWKTALAISAQTVRGGRNANGRTSASRTVNR